MQMSDTQRIAAPKAAVWAALNDPEVLKRCVPGCQSLDMTTPNEMVAAVSIKLGPIKANFSGKVTLLEIDPPNGYRIVGEGSGGIAGYAKGSARVRLESESEQVTLLHYEVDSQVGGKLAQLGGRMIDSFARKLAGEFFSAFAATLDGPVQQEKIA